MKNFTILFFTICVMCISVSAQDLSGPESWKLILLNGTNVESGKAEIVFAKGDENRFTGNAGCNSMFGSYARKGKSIKFSGIVTTDMMCMTGAVTLRENEFLKLLGEAARFKKNGNFLTIYAGNRAVLKFKAVYKINSPAARLEDRKWILELIGKDNLGKIGEVAFINFDAAKGSAGGNTGCNVFGGSYKSDGNKLKITDVISTMRACIENDGMTVERGFLDGLRDTDRYEIKNNKLYLYVGKKLLLTFRGEAK